MLRNMGGGGTGNCGKLRIFGDNLWGHVFKESLGDSVTTKIRYQIFLCPGLPFKWLLLGHLQ